MNNSLSLHYKRKHEKNVVMCSAHNIFGVAVVLGGKCPGWQLSWVAVVCAAVFQVAVVRMPYSVVWFLMQMCAPKFSEIQNL